MSTPAVNINSIQEAVSDDGYITYLEPGSGATWNNSLGSLSYGITRKIKIRPASTSVGIDPTGWRAMTNWSHTWGYGVSNFGNVVMRRSPVGPFAQPILKFYPDGTFWGKDALKRPALPSPPSFLRRKVELELLERLRNSDFDLGVALAEARETAHTISSTMERIACEVKRFRKANRRNVWDKIRRFEGTPRWKEVPPQWLALQYGWNPLMADCLGAMQHLERTAKTAGQVVHVKASASHQEERYVDVAPQAAYYGSYNRYKQSIVHAGTANLWMQVNSPTLVALNSLGLINPASIAWERVPYSFVVDWFIPVGSWINGFSAAAGYSFKAGCYSSKSTLREMLVESHIDKTWLAGWELSDTWDFKWSEGSFTRDVYTSTPVPGLYFKSPFSSTHVANAMALLSAAFR